MFLSPARLYRPTISKALRNLKMDIIVFRGQESYRVLCEALASNPEFYHFQLLREQLGFLSNVLVLVAYHVENSCVFEALCDRYGHVRGTRSCGSCDVDGDF